nr:MAG TPA: hypothetical protein [Siphoviridae sp. ctYuc6]
MQNRSDFRTEKQNNDFRLSTFDFRLSTFDFRLSTFDFVSLEHRAGEPGIFIAQNW